MYIVVIVAIVEKMLCVASASVLLGAREKATNKQLVIIIF
jgi:hypothetical protein